MAKPIRQPLQMKPIAKTPASAKSVVKPAPTPKPSPRPLSNPAPTSRDAISLLTSMTASRAEVTATDERGGPAANDLLGYDDLIEMANRPRSKVQTSSVGPAVGIAENPAGQNRTPPLTVPVANGIALPTAIVTEVQAGAGEDLSDVQVHPDAVLDARSKARATPTDIFFSPGDYAPGTPDGDALLGHELAHILQFRQHRSAAESLGKDETSAGAQGLESEANQAEQAINAGMTVGQAAVAIARSQVGTVKAKEPGEVDAETGKVTRFGWQHLDSYFEGAYGGRAATDGKGYGPALQKSVKFYVQAGNVAQSWCGIFAVWALKRAGAPIGTWKIGVGATGIAGLRPTTSPRTGDIGYMGGEDDHQHHCLVIDASTDPVHTVDGNTRGDGISGGEIAENHRPRAKLTGYFTFRPKGDESEGPKVGADVVIPAAGLAGTTSTPAYQAEVDIPLEAPEAAPTTHGQSPGLQASGQSSGQAVGEGADAVTEEGFVAEVAGGDGKAVEPEALAGDTPGEMVHEFADATPTQRAYAWNEFGADTGKAAHNEEATFQETIPEFSATLDGDNVAIEPLGDDAYAVDTAEEPSAPGGGNLPDVDVPLTPTPLPYRANDAIEKKVEEEAGSADDVKHAIRSSSVTDSGINTNPGVAPALPLTGAADPVQVREASTDRQKQANESLRTAQKALRDGPGPEIIRPEGMDEASPMAELSTPDLGVTNPVSGVDQYVAMKLPADVAASFDATHQDQLQSGVDQARADVEKATTERDSSREEAISDAETEHGNATREAQAERNKVVDDTQKDIGKEKAATLNKQQKAVAGLNSDIDQKRADQKKEIDDRVHTDEGKIKDRYHEAEKEAKGHVAKGEKDAHQKQDDALKETEDESWWSSAINSLKDSFNKFKEAVNSIFDWVRKKVNEALDAAKKYAAELIDVGVKWVQDRVKDFGASLKWMVNTFLADDFPDFANDFNNFVDKGVEWVNEKVAQIGEGLKKAVDFLVEGLRAGLNKYLDIWQGAFNAAMTFLEAVVTGDWEKVGRMVIEAILRILGIPPESFWKVVEKIEFIIDDIANDPIKFANNLMAALKQGFQNFFDNFLTHLLKGLIEWLVSGLKGTDIAIVVPKEFTPKSILGLFLSIMGISWANIRKLLVKHMGAVAVGKAEKVAGLLGKAYELVQVWMDKGAAGIVEMIKEQLNPQTLVDAVMKAAADYVIKTLVKQAAIRIFAMLNPAGAIAQAVMAIYKALKWLYNNAARIFTLIETVVNSAYDLVQGNVKAAAKGVEWALSKLLVPVIDLLAEQVGLGDLPEQVADVIRGLQEAVNEALDKAIAWVVEKARGLLDAIGLGKKDDNKGDTELGENVAFSAAGEGHHLWIDIQGADAVVMVASKDPKTLSDKLAEWKGKLDGLDDKDKAEASVLIGSSENLLGNLDAKADKLVAEFETAKKLVREAAEAKGEPIPDDSEVESAEQALVPIVRRLLELFGETVPDKIAPRIDVEFTVNSKLGHQAYRDEYDRQLNMQENAINNMDVQTWLGNRDAFKHYGRDPASKDLQTAERERLGNLLVDRLQQPLGSTTTEAEEVRSDKYLMKFVDDMFNQYLNKQKKRGGLYKVDAAKEVDWWMSLQHVLHSPDQVAGGKANDITGVGSSEVNSDIGANWGGVFGKPQKLADSLEDGVKSTMKKMKIAPTFWRLVKMWVSLKAK